MKSLQALEEQYKTEDGFKIVEYQSFRFAQLANYAAPEIKIFPQQHDQCEIAMQPAVSKV